MKIFFFTKTKIYFSKKYTITPPQWTSNQLISIGMEAIILMTKINSVEDKQTILRELGRDIPPLDYAQILGLSAENFDTEKEVTLENVCETYIRLCMANQKPNSDTDNSISNEFPELNGNYNSGVDVSPQLE